MSQSPEAGQFDNVSDLTAKQRLWLDLGMAIAVLCYCFFVWLTSLLLGKSELYSPVIYLPIIAFAVWLTILGYIAVSLLITGVFVRPPSLKGYLVQQVREKSGDRQHILHIALHFTLLVILMSSYTSLKSLLPDIAEFNLDSTWMTIDRSAHNGLDPWQLTHHCFSNLFWTKLLDTLYGCWFYWMFGVLVYQVFTRKHTRLKYRFLIALYLGWIVIGSILAWCFASAGPCYYSEFVDGDSSFAPLMDRLNQMHQQSELWSLNTQQRLLNDYTHRELGLGSGISAMPSMHVSIAFLLFLWSAKVNRGLAAVFFVLFVATLIGSVHLGWHYAIDGYLAVIAVLAIWWASGLLIDRIAIQAGNRPKTDCTGPRKRA